MRARPDSAAEWAVCVYCAAGPTHRELLGLATEVGEGIAERGWILVWGGGHVSAMGAVATAARARRGRTVGVIPEMLMRREVADTDADELIVTSTLRERKQVMEDRADAMDYYLGDMRKDMPAQDGRSRAVSTDVADTIEGMMPGLMDIFAGGDEVVRFEPVGPEDEAAAQQETDYVNHVFMQQNPGFMVLYSFVKDALLS